jgi:PPOX class probable F420-dependent enzyme
MTPLSKAHIKLIQEKNFGFLATVNRDGSPQVTPVWVDTDGEFLLVNTAIGRVKERNTRRDPRVAVSIAEQKNPYNWITVNGKVMEWIEGGNAEAHIDKLAKKYTGAEKFTKSNPNERRVIFKINPERVLGWT